MAQLKDHFLNVIVCDDIREEVGNKKSLMGVIGGDFVVPSFPANILISLYSEFVSPEPTKEISILLTLYADDKEMAKAEILFPPIESNGLIVLPKGIMIFEKESTFRVIASVGSQTCEIVNKKVLLGTT